MWIALKNRYEKRSMASVISHTNKFQNLRYLPNRNTFEKFCTEFDKTVHELYEAGTKYDLRQQNIHFLIAMPSEYDSVVTSLRTVAASQDLNMEIVRLQIEEYELGHDRKKRLKDVNFQPVALAGFRRRGGMTSPIFRFQCKNCGRVGHKIADCFRPGGGAHQRHRGREGCGPFRESRGNQHLQDSGGHQDRNSSNYRGRGGTEVVINLILQI
jgi:hypothetical protein